MATYGEACPTDVATKKDTEQNIARTCLHSLMKCSGSVSTSHPKPDVHPQIVITLLAQIKLQTIPQISFHVRDNLEMSSFHVWHRYFCFDPVIGCFSLFLLLFRRQHRLIKKQCRCAQNDPECVFRTNPSFSGKRVSIKECHAKCLLIHHASTSVVHMSSMTHRSTYQARFICHQCKS